MKLRRPSARYYAGALVSGREDHWVEPDQAARWWSGRAAVELGLAGEVDETSLAAVLVGRTPDGAERLGGGQRTVGAFDLVLAAPKSVSVLAALAPPEQVATVEQAHELAVRSAVGFLEAHLARVRDRRGGGDRLEPAGSVAAVFCHRTSRALDPHLHAHVVLANVGRDGGGTWRALDARPLFAEARTVGALYQAELRARLVAALGIRFTTAERSTIQVGGIDEALRTRFSQRGAEVDRQLADWFPEPERAGPRARALAALVTRPPKERGWELPELRARWAERAGPLGRSAVAHVLECGRERLGRIEGRENRSLLPRSEGAFAALAREVLAVELARGWAPTTFDLHRAWCASLPDGATLGEIQAATEALTRGRLGERLGLVALGAALEPSEVWRRRRGGVVPVAPLSGRWARLEDARSLRALVDIAERVARRGLGRLDECAAGAALACALDGRPDLAGLLTRALGGSSDVVALTVAERDQTALLRAIAAIGDERDRAVVVVTPERSLDEGGVQACSPGELGDLCRRLADRGRPALVLVPAADRAHVSVLERAAWLAEVTGGRAVLIGARRGWVPAPLAGLDREGGRDGPDRRASPGPAGAGRTKAKDLSRAAARLEPVFPLRLVPDRRRTRGVGEDVPWPGPGDRSHGRSIGRW